MLFAPGDDLCDVGGNHRTGHGSYRYSVVYSMSLEYTVLDGVGFSLGYIPIWLACIVYIISFIIASDTVLIVGGVGCNMRLQQMMQGMVDERGGTLCAMDNRCVSISACMIDYRMNFMC